MKKSIKVILVILGIIFIISLSTKKKETVNQQTTSTTPIAIPVSTPSATPTPKVEIISINNYQVIYDKYVAKLKSECPLLSMTECATISNEGISEMAKYMYASKGTEGQYQTYSDWASKLMDIYMEEAR